MAKLYHVDIARHAADADAKWVDNLLSHFAIPGVESGRQGSPRRISLLGIQHIALVRALTRELGLSVGSAVSLATRLLVGSAPELPVGDWLQLRFDRQAFERQVEHQIADGVESVAPARRGRPRLRRHADS